MRRRNILNVFNKNFLQVLVLSMNLHVSYVKFSGEPEKCVCQPCPLDPWALPELKMNNRYYYW